MLRTFTCKNRENLGKWRHARREPKLNALKRRNGRDSKRLRDVQRKKQKELKRP